MYCVLVATSIPDHLRGYLSRFLTEVDTGVYVGNSSPPVVSSLWERAVSAAGAGQLVLVQSDHTCEQGFSLQYHGTTEIKVEDFDGIALATKTLGAKNGSSAE